MNKTRTTLLIIITAVIIIMGIGTYAFFTADITGNVDQDNIVQTTGTLRIEYTEGQNIDANKIRPGWSGIKTFTIKNTGTLPVNYDIVFADLVNTFINDEVLYRINCNSNQDSCDGIPESVVETDEFFVKQNVIIKPNEEHEYEIEIEFIETGANQDYNNDATLSGKISVYEANTYILKLKFDVDILENMIPITWNEDKWIKTDLTNPNNEWHDYNNQKWANAVLVTDNSREAYKNANKGTEIIEEDILAYYVYVPRYRYQLWNVNLNENCLNDNCAEQEIKIEFEKKDKEKSLGEQNGEWLTHPAFTFGETELSGIWVGKFTTSVEPGANCFTYPSVSSCNNKTLTPRIKPNVDMWRYIQLANMFSVSKKLETESMYGLSSYDNVDSHLIKNMEWGAIAYLSHSKYGKYGNENYAGADKQLYINSLEEGDYERYRRKTGCSSGGPSVARVSSCLYPYPMQTPEATGASTTGNIYGIYDMSGGVNEYVMGNMAQNGYPLGAFHANTSSGTWDYTPNRKYYDSYVYGTTSNSYERGYLGDATRETLTTSGINIRGWYSNRSQLPSSSNVWFARGGDPVNGAHSGIFTYSAYNGQSHLSTGFRVTLVIE